jgi:cytosine/adenosine deaminase-related metal-dependent hydrolase
MSLVGFEGAWLLPCAPGTLPIEAGAVVLDREGRVRGVGPARELRARFAEARWSVEPSILLPGLVNAHTHLELSALRGQTRSGGGFGPWVSSMMAARARLRPELDLEAIDAAVSELLRAGTVAVGEVTNTLASVEALGSAPLLGRVFHEVYGLSQASAAEMLSAAEAARARLGSVPQNLSYALSPHTLYSLHPQSVRELVARTRADGARISLHLSEHVAERAFLRDFSGPFAEYLTSRGVPAPDFAPPGLSPIAYAEQLGVLGPDVICVHLCATQRDELSRVRAAGAPSVLCPRSNLFIELKLPPLYDILDVGLLPGLGSDSLASNTTLDVLQEAAALRDRFPEVDPYLLVQMATHYGALALGLEHRVGSLREGLAPGLVAIDVSAPVDDPARHVLRFPTAPRRVLTRAAMPTSDRPLGAAP